MDGSRSAASQTAVGGAYRLAAPEAITCISVIISCLQLIVFDTFAKICIAT